MKDRIKILKAFKDMGAGFTDVIEETIKLFTDREYFNEWNTIITGEKA